MRIFSNSVFSKSKKFHAGFGLIELMFCLGIIAFVMLALASMSIHLNKSVTTNAGRSELHVVRQNIVALTMSDAAWRKTTLMNGWTCLTTDGTTCPNIGLSRARDFALYDASGELFYDGADGLNGITNDGRRCGPHAGSDSPLRNKFYPSAECPHSFQLRWFGAVNAGKPVVGIVITLKRGLQRTRRGSTVNVSDFEDLAVNYNRYSMPTMFRSPQ